jgi:hypothetical protein
VWSFENHDPKAILKRLMQSTPEFFIFYFFKKRAASKVPNPTQYNLFRSRQESYCSQRAIFPIMGKILSRGQEDALFLVIFMFHMVYPLSNIFIVD